MTFDQVPHTARHLLDKHGLTAKGWTFVWDHAKRRAGCCRYGSQTISLSRHYVQLNIVSRPDDVMDTILHEIAHALAGPRTNHGPVWREICCQIGANPQRCLDISRVELPKGKLVATCGGCGKKFRRHKQVRHYHLGNYRYCTSCGPDRGRLAFKLFEDNNPTLIGCTVNREEIPPAPKKLRG